MKYINFKTTITILAVSLILVSCNETKTNDKEKSLTEKEIELLKKENELLKREQELNKSKEIEESNISKDKYSSINKLDFLKKLDGKYPYEVKLLDNSVFMKRLKNLLGNERYAFLKDNWATEMPIQFSDNIFVAEGCQAHNCGATKFIIVYNFNNNVIYAGIREEEYAKTFSEDGSFSTKIINWKKNE
jgi:hypothetical protein